MTEHHLTINGTKVVLKDGMWGLPTLSGGLAWVSCNFVNELSKTANKLKPLPIPSPYSQWIRINSEAQAADLRVRFMKIVSKLARRNPDHKFTLADFLTLYNIKPGNVVRFKYVYNSTRYGKGYETYQIPNKKERSQKRKKFIKLMEVY